MKIIARNVKILQKKKMNASHVMKDIIFLPTPYQRQNAINAQLTDARHVMLIQVIA